MVLSFERGCLKWLTALCLFLLSFVDAAVCAPTSTTEDVSNKARLLTMTAAILFATMPTELGFAGPRQHDIRGHKHRKRSRTPVPATFQELGPYCVRRAYRMTEADCWALLKLIEPLLRSKRSLKKKQRNGARNGLIKPSSRLSAAMRYFAGGRPEDIAVVHGISHSEAFNSAWRACDAVNKCPALAFEFPEDHGKQRDIARGFLSKCKGPSFDCVAGAVDGMLVWTEKPTDRVCKQATCGARKFFCGRKHKCGLNMQGCCDHECRFLDVEVFHPASTADFLVFTTSSLYRKLEIPGFLGKGLSLFGDAACVRLARQIWQPHPQRCPVLFRGFRIRLPALVVLESQGCHHPSHHSG